MSREADNLDNAAELTQQVSDDAVALVRRAARPEQVQNADGSWPVTECECGEDIPPERLVMGKIRCVCCQTLLERERRIR